MVVTQLLIITIRYSRNHSCELVIRRLRLNPMDLIRDLVLFKINGGISYFTLTVQLVRVTSPSLTCHSMNACGSTPMATSASGRRALAHNFIYIRVLVRMFWWAKEICKY